MENRVVSRRSLQAWWRRRARFVALITLVVAAVGMAVFASRQTGRNAGLAVGQEASALRRAARQLRTQVVRSYPHDPDAFTQGLVLDGQFLLESTGLVGRSSLRRVDLDTGRVLHHVALEDGLFGEGLASVPGLLIQLTWTDQVALVYHAHSLELRRRVPYAGQGWGLCFDGASLVMSDGSHRLTFRDPDTFAVRRSVDVMMDGTALRNLNELECVAGSVYANVWHSDTIVRIDSTTGQVLDRIDASGLLTDRERQAADVLNGIAHDPSDGTFLVTGKLWPKLFKVRFVPPS
jgi:glutaminyl-peptide cyclotransferase